MKIPQLKNPIIYGALGLFTMTAGCVASKKAAPSSDAFTAYLSERIESQNIPVDSSVYRIYPHLKLISDMKNFVSARDRDEEGMQVFYHYDPKKNKDPKNPTIIFFIDGFQDIIRDNRYTGEDLTSSEARIRYKNEAVFYKLRYAKPGHPYQLFDIYYEAYDKKSKQWQERAHYVSTSGLGNKFEYYLQNAVTLAATDPDGSKKLVKAAAKSQQAALALIK